MRYLAIAAVVMLILVGVIFNTAGKKMMGAATGEVAVVLPEADSVGAGLYRKYCKQCHGLPEIETHTAADWPRAVERMMKNMSASGQQMPDKGEHELIVNYLVRNAK